MTESRSAGAGKGNSRRHKIAAEGLSVSETAPRRPGSEAEAVPLRLRFRDDGLGKVTKNLSPDLSEIVVELPLSTMSRFLSKRLAVELYQVIRKCIEDTERCSFPYTLAELRQNRGLLAALRPRLAIIENLVALIADPPPVLMDERQKLCFFKGLPLALRPITFRYLFLLAQSPGKFVTRTAIYNQLWPGEMNYEGSDKPYERQVTDHKYQLAAEIKKGMAGRLPLSAGEIEGLVSTQYKQGYRLNLSPEEVLVFTRKDLLVFAFLFLLRKWFDAFSGWLPFWRCLGSIGIWPGQFSL